MHQLVCQNHQSPVMLQNITSLYRSPYQTVSQLIKTSWHRCCCSAPLTRWSSSHSTSRATRWCTGRHQRGFRGATGPCLRCATPGKTAPWCLSFGRESHTNSKSAPSSTSSRERTVMSKLARRWRKVRETWMDAAVCMCAIVSAPVCAHVFMFTQSCAHGAPFGERAAAVPSCEGRIMFKCGVFEHARGPCSAL